MNQTDYEPGTALGIISAQAIAQPLTQNTLSSFHTSGNKNNTIGNIKKFKQLTQNINDNSKTSCFIKIHKYLTEKQINSELVYKSLSDILETIKVYKSENYTNRYINTNDVLLDQHKYVTVLKIYKKYQYNYMNLLDIHNKIKRYLDFKYPNNFNIFVTPEHNSEILVYSQDDIRDHINLEAVHIGGITNILEIEDIKREKSYTSIITVGSNLKGLLNNKYVDKHSLTSNNVLDNFVTFGIETCKIVLFNDLSKICGNEHASMLTDCITVTGEIVPITSKGVGIISKSFLSNISYEKSINTIKKTVPFGIQEKINNINSFLVVGKRPCIGTNMFTLFKKKRKKIYKILFQGK